MHHVIAIFKSHRVFCERLRSNKKNYNNELIFFHTIDAESLAYTHGQQADIGLEILKYIQHQKETPDHSVFASPDAMILSYFVWPSRNDEHFVVLKIHSSFHASEHCEDILKVPPGFLRETAAQQKKLQQ